MKSQSILLKDIGLSLCVGIFLLGCVPKMINQRDNAQRKEEREEMVESQLVEKGITDQKVLAAMRRVPRHHFVPPAQKEQAYGDFPLPIGYGQTISQPFIVAYMTQALDLKPHEKILEIGTGSGYQAAILSQLCAEVFTIEIVEPLGRQAQKTFAALGYKNITGRVGDGYRGWPEEGPFDAIILTAAPPHVPGPLLEQLSMGGRVILPEGDAFQRLVIIRKTEKGYQRTELLPVAFVPMTGEINH